MMVLEAKNWNFDVDKYINPFVPANRTSRLPRPISHFLGHRGTPRKEIGNLLVALWAFLGAFIGIVVIEAFFMIPAIQHHGVPLLIASSGAAAVLEYNAIDSPLAQPRNALLGHALAALAGISITKLFALDSDFEKLRWLAGALACGSASALMTITNTVYPPAGATALLAAVDPQVERLGWYLLPLVCLSAVLTLIISLLVGNIQRQYPIYWWTPAELGKKGLTQDVEKLAERVASSQGSSNPGNLSRDHDELLSIRVSRHEIDVPTDFVLAQEEKDVLEVLRNRLKEEFRRQTE